MTKPSHAPLAKGLAVALASSVLLPLGASAQEGAQAAPDIDVAALREIDDDRTDITHEGFTIEEIEDMKLVRDGQVVGEVEAVLGDASDNVVALAVELERLGPGPDEVVVPIDRVEFSAERREVQSPLSDEELAALPRWDD